MTTSRSETKTIVLKPDHVLPALTTYLQAMSLIDDNYEVLKFKKSPEGLEVQIGKL